MKIVVTTPTGSVGSRVVRLLLQAGQRPTLLLRDAGRLDPATRALVDTVEGDQRDVDVVLRATEGADALYWVNPPTDDDDPVEAQRRLGRIAARAVVDNGIARTVLQSSVGAEERTGAGDIDGLAATEVALDGTGASVTHLRCGMFFTNLLLDPGLGEGVLRVALPVDMPLPWVDPRDVGDVAAVRLLSTAWTGRHVQAVHGPEDLSWAQVAAVVSAATGRSVRAERVPDDAIRSGLRAAGLTDPQVEAILGMSTGLRDGFVPEDGRSLVTTTPGTLAAWAYEHLDQQASQALAG
ncbi:NmrA family NAD(P)-binding protein [Blastococcus sp. SYSU DS1024]